MAGLAILLAVSQYAHTVWTIRDGFFKGNIDAMAQAPEGYLWLGTEFGYKATPRGRKPTPRSIISWPRGTIKANRWASCSALDASPISFP